MSQGKHRSDGVETRAKILDTALTLFRKKGFDATTMREVAKEADLSLGAAYHYFPSKQAIVLAYYETRQEKHRELARAAYADSTTLRERVRGALMTGLELVQRDRAVLTALARSAIDPSDPVSAFSEETKPIREGAIALFREALEHKSVPEDMRDALARGLWALHMGVIMFYVYDTSPKAQRTRVLCENLVDFVPDAIKWLSSPLAKPIRKELVRMLIEAGLLPASS